MQTRLNEKILEKVQNGFTDYQFTVEVLAREVGLSVSALRERSHFHYKMSPRKLIETVRLEEALKLISKNHTQCLYEVCCNVGYLSLRTFLDAFKKRLNITPTEWKDTMGDWKNDCKELEKWIKLLWSDGTVSENFR